MEINRHLSILLVLVAVSFAVTTLSISPAWAVTGGPKKAYTKAEKRHASSGARRIKEINGSYVAQAKPQNVAVAPTPVCYGGWAQSWNGPVYISWCPAPAYGGSSGQTSGWAAPAGASGSQTGAAPMTGGYTSQPPPANLAARREASVTAVAFRVGTDRLIPGADLQRPIAEFPDRPVVGQPRHKHLGDMFPRLRQQMLAACLPLHAPTAVGCRVRQRLPPRETCVPRLSAIDFGSGWYRTRTSGHFAANELQAKSSGKSLSLLLPT